MNVMGIMYHAGGGYVSSAIDKFIQQSYKHLHLIVMDDGSNDESWEDVKKFNETEGLSIFRLDQPQGLAFCNNFAVQQTMNMGNIQAFAFLNSRSLWEKHKLHKSISILKDQYGYPGLVYSDYHVIDERRRIDHPSFCEPYSLHALKRRKVDEQNFVVTTQAIISAGEFDNPINFYLRLSLKFMPVHIPETLVTLYK